MSSKSSYKAKLNHKKYFHYSNDAIYVNNYQCFLFTSMYVHTQTHIYYILAISLVSFPEFCRTKAYKIECPVSRSQC